MAKKSKIARNEQRKVVVDRYAAKRAELKKALVSPGVHRRAARSRPRRPAEAAQERFAGARAHPRRHRRPPPRCPHEVRHLACPLP